MKKRNLLYVGPLLLVIGIALIVSSRNMVSADVDPLTANQLVSSQATSQATTDAANSMGLLGYVFGAAGLMGTVATIFALL